MYGTLPLEVNPMELSVLFIYILVLWIISILCTVIDKWAAKRKKRRIPEATLLWLGFLGGAAGMLVTMKLIRHKTKKKKFMITLPVFIVIHILLMALGCHFYNIL